MWQPPRKDYYWNMHLTKRLFATGFAILAIPLLLLKRRQPMTTISPVQAASTSTEKPAPTPESTSTPTATPEHTPEPTPAPEPFSIAWMSDTQTYTAANSDVFGRMTQWISDTQKEYNTVLTVHTGDIVYNPYQEIAWQNAEDGFRRLPEGMRILTVAGNHDQLPKYDKHTPYLDHRPDTDVETKQAFDETGYVYYTTFTAGGVPMLVFSLSYGHEVEAIDWINEICKQYSDHYAVLCLHSYVNFSGYPSIGSRMFERVVKQSPNIRLVLCGHDGGMLYVPEQLDDNADGTPDRTVHQMMMNLQDDPYNGVGYLRILRLDPTADTLEVITYSPILDRFGYKMMVGDHFGESTVLEGAGLRDFLPKETTATP